MTINIARTALPIAALALVAPTGGAAQLADAGASLTINFEKLRSAKGLLRLCLTKLKAHFPDCSDDPNAITLSVAAKGRVAVFRNLPAGSYALAVLHDKNSDGKMNKFAGIPKEGVGFSRNPKMSFGPPKFSAALFEKSSEAKTLTVRMKYFL